MFIAIMRGGVRRERKARKEGAKGRRERKARKEGAKGRRERKARKEGIKKCAYKMRIFVVPNSVCLKYLFF